MSDQISIDEIKSRLEVIEKRLNIPNPAAKKNPIPVENSSPSSNYSSDNSFTSNESHTSYFTSANVLAFAGFLCLFLAAVFIILAAIDLGWLTPARQCSAAAVLGALLIWAGFALKEKDSGYASFLPAAGVGSLYAALYGAHLYYQLLNPTTALSLSILVSLFSIYLFTVFRSDVFAVISTIGSYTVPILIVTPWNSFEWTSIYFLFWSSIYAVLSVLVKSRSITLIASYLGIGLYSFLSIGKGDYLSIAAFVQLAQFLVLFVGTVCFSIVNRSPLSTKESLFFYPILLFFYSSEFNSLHHVMPSLAPYVMVLLALIVVFGFLTAKRYLQEPAGSASLVQAYCSLTFIHSVYFEIFTDEYRPLVLILFILLSFFSSVSRTSFLQSLTAQCSLLFVAIIEYASLLEKLTGNSSMHQTDPLSILYAIVLSGLFTARGIQSVLKDSSTGMLFFILGHSLGLAALYAFLVDAGSILVTAAWVFFGGFILYLGFSKKIKPLAKSSVFILLFAFLKLFLYDVSESSDSIRFISFLMTGIALYVSGWILKKIDRIDPVVP
jgi:uncharacterized membrane protein